MLDLGEFRRLVRQALTVHSRWGVLQDDAKSDHFHLTDGRVMVSTSNLLVLTAVNSLAKSHEGNEHCFSRILLEPGQ